MGNVGGRSCFKKAEGESNVLVISSTASHSNFWWDGSHVQKSWHFVRQQRAEESPDLSSEEHVYESMSDRSTNEDMATQTSICDDPFADYSLPGIDHLYSEIRKYVPENRDDAEVYESVPATLCRPNGPNVYNPAEIDEFQQFYAEYNNYMSVVRLTKISKDVSSMLSDLQFDRIRVNQVVDEVRQLTRRLNALESTKKELIDVVHQHELMSSTNTNFDRLPCSCHRNCA
uniref:Uncharacterized protein n=1 Tax=Plectus sambesii TaxID=2011161 RepID=A0A914VYL2_9BILA